MGGRSLLIESDDLEWKMPQGHVYNRYIKSLMGIPMKTIKKQSGVTLIEVLITLLLVSVGMLTTLGMQVKSKEALYDAVQRTSASHLVYDISEKMRSNGLARASYYGTFGGSTQAGQACSSGAPCTPAELAALDLFEWERMLDGLAEQVGGNAAGGLISPQACITGPAGGGQGTYTISVAWRGVKELSNPTINDCGEGSGLYGAADEFRRIVTHTLYML